MAGRYNTELIVDAQQMSLRYAEKETDRATFQAMEAFIHNLNTWGHNTGG